MKLNSQISLPQTDHRSDSIIYTPLTKASTSVNLQSEKNSASALFGAGRKTRVHRGRGCSPPFFYEFFFISIDYTHLFKLSEGKTINMSELSIFIDESGDFGDYDYHSPYYIISMVYHDQSTDISKPLHSLANQLSSIGYEPDHCIHTGPIIRRENEYEYETIDTRRKIFNYMVTFIKHIDVRFKCFFIEKY